MFYLCIYRSKKFGLDENILWGIFYCAIAGGLVGTRVLYYIVELPAIIKDPSILWDFKNGYVVYGGIIGGIFTATEGAVVAVVYSLILSLYLVNFHCS